MFEFIILEFMFLEFIFEFILEFIFEFILEFIFEFILEFMPMFPELLLFIIGDEVAIGIGVAIFELLVK